MCIRDRDSKALAPLLSEVRLHQGLLVGKMRGYGLASRSTATLKVLTEETIKSSAIEGVVLNPENVRSSLARRLGLEVGGFTAHKDRNVDGVVEMMLDATQKLDVYKRQGQGIRAIHESSGVSIAFQTAVQARRRRKLARFLSRSTGGQSFRQRRDACRIQKTAHSKRLPVGYVEGSES